MAQPDFLPSSGDAEFGEQVDNITRLLTELQALAKNNPGFKAARRDFVDFEVAEGDVVEDVDNPVETHEVVYGFSAIRHRSPRVGTSLHFEFSQTDRRRNVTVPPSVLEDAIGLPADQAGKEIADATFELSHTFRIATDDNHLSVCETYTYYDDEGDIIHLVCSCGDDHIDPVPVEASGQHPEDMLHVIGEVLGKSSRPQAPRQESIVATSNEEAGQLDALFEQGTATIFDQDEVQQDNAARGLEVLAAVRRALLIQAGALNLGPLVVRNETIE